MGLVVGGGIRDYFDELMEKAVAPSFEVDISAHARAGAAQDLVLRIFGDGASV